jgi:hypothetical protein
MRRIEMRKMVILLIACFLLFDSTMAFADLDEGFVAIGDLVISRPLGLAVTVFGGAVFLVALPFALTSGSVNDTADVLVGEPFRFTFKRPLGNFRQGSSSAPEKTQKDQNRDHPE